MHPAVLVILNQVLGRRRWTGGRVRAGERVTVAARPNGRGDGRGVGIGLEAAVLAPAHEGRHARLAQVQRPLHWVIAGVEDEQGHPPVGGQVAHQVWTRAAATLFASSPGRMRCTSCVVSVIACQAELIDLLIGPARHDRLACKVARRVIVVATLGTGLGVTARPDARVDDVDRLPVGERVARQEVEHRPARHAATREGGHARGRRRCCPTHGDGPGSGSSAPARGPGLR